MTRHSPIEAALFVGRSESALIEERERISAAIRTDREAEQRLTELMIEIVL